MIKRTDEDAQAVIDLEKVLVHLARAGQRMAYVDGYLEERGGQPGRVWQMIADAQCAVEEMLEDETLDDAAKIGLTPAKPIRSDRRTYVLVRFY